MVIFSFFTISTKLVLNYNLRAIINIMFPLPPKEGGETRLLEVTQREVIKKLVSLPCCNSRANIIIEFAFSEC